jgi:hypothetical protein
MEIWRRFPDRRLTWIKPALKLVAAMLLAGCLSLKLAAPALDHPSSPPAI